MTALITIYPRWRIKTKTCLLYLDRTTDQFWKRLYTVSQKTVKIAFAITLSNLYQLG